MLKNNKIYRVLSLIVTIVFMLASVPVQEVRAAEGDPEIFVITSFDKADEWKLEKTSFEPGTEIKDMGFPTEWLVKGYLEADEGKTEQEKTLEELIWEGHPVTEETDTKIAEEAEETSEVLYDTEAEPGEYLFTLKLPDGFKTAEEVKVPSQKIRIQEEVKSKEAYITVFKIGTWEGKITSDDKGNYIDLVVPYGTDVTSLVPEFEISDKAAVDKSSGTAQNFTNPVTYTVTAEDGTTKTTYTVRVNAACAHEWQEATCTEAKTCKICKATEGEALGHQWKEATCTEAKTCERCKVTEGEALGHQWKEATCTEAKTCERCKVTEGEALGHQWKEATCTEAKTCERCKVTEGEALGHQWKEATCTEAKTCERCKVTEGEALGHQWKEATCTEAKTCERCKATEGEALGHKWGEADCIHPETCSRCQITRGVALGHNWAAWKVTKQPTTKEGGLEERICTRCEEKETRETLRLNIIGKPENNHITGIKEKGVYGIDEVIHITAHGDGMDIKNPIANDVRYVPAGWKVTSYFEWTKAPYQVGFSVKSEGNYQLEVSFCKQIYDGKNWINQKETDVKKVDFTVSASKVVPAKTGDETPIGQLVLAMVLALLVMMIPVGWKMRKMSR